jgi:hypothetical protein
MHIFSANELFKLFIIETLSIYSNLIALLGLVPYTVIELPYMVTNQKGYFVFICLLNQKKALTIINK